MPFSEKGNKRIIVECDCGCSVIEIDQWVEKDKMSEVYLCHLIPSFFSLQSPGWNKLKNAVKMIWCIITGKEYLFYDVILAKKQQIIDFKNAVAQLDENIDN